MNDRELITGSNPEVPANMSYVTNWDKINWTIVTKHVNKLQTRIAKAVKTGNNRLVKKLTYLLTHSYYAKLLAVRKVTSNKGKKTPGVDGTIWITPEDKLQAAASLTDKNYKAKPLRRVLIEKKGKTTKRPLGIPTMYDRAMQALYAFALYPIAETTGDSHSFGFRMGRAAQDAIQYIFSATASKNRAEWILDADIHGCFDWISHEWLLQNIPMDKTILKQFLKAGFIFEDELFPTEYGTPQGGIISPILANMTLDGLQKELTNRFKNQKVNLCRYADDMAITAKSEEIAKEVKKVVAEFLKERGLELSEEKTRIVHISQGFDFLGQNIRKYNGKILIQPSQKSVKFFDDKLHEAVLETGKALTQENLIKKLNPILRGWSNYHRNVCSKKTFRHIAHNLYQKLQRWATRKHPKKSVKWIEQRYWHKAGNNNWVFSDEKNVLFDIASVKIERRTALKLDMNPFLDWKYFANRKTKLQKAN